MMYPPHGNSKQGPAGTAKFALAGLVLVGLTLGGCARAKPQVAYRRSGDITTFKRYERHAERDFLHHFTRTAYRPPRASLKGSHLDQETIIETWGRPDYVRKSFLSLQGDRIEEWLYLDRQRVMQFVKGALIFDGPLTDLEQLYLQYGYPDRVAFFSRN